MTLGSAWAGVCQVETTHLRRAAEGGRCAVVLNVLLAEPKVSEDDVAL